MFKPNAEPPHLPTFRRDTCRAAPCQAYRAARKEQAVVLEKQEREFRMVLARCGTEYTVEISYIQLSSGWFN